MGQKLAALCLKCTNRTEAFRPRIQHSSIYLIINHYLLASAALIAPPLNLLQLITHISHVCRRPLPAGQQAVPHCGFNASGPPLWWWI